MGVAWGGNEGCGLGHVVVEGLGQSLWAMRSHGRLWSKRYKTVTWFLWVVRGYLEMEETPLSPGC